MPKSRKRRAVILVGLEHSDLADRLRLKGLETMEAASPEAVPSLLRTMPRSAIVVYNRGAASRDAQQVLAAVAALHRRAPVVVLVDETDFGEYYSLMGSGALEYFAMSERPELIVRGIEWATEDRAS
ncbi:MAG: hypothetical protein GC160_21445 [Acidobacteria bacterium]|nr:hypothetical protein [Acidobacteriota bacterium]